MKKSLKNKAVSEDKHNDKVGLPEPVALLPDLYRLLVEQVNDVIWTLSLDGHYLYVSPSVEALRGYSPSEVIMQPINQSLTPDSFVRVQQALTIFNEKLRQGIRDTAPYIYEVEQTCKDGTTVWTELVISAIFNSDGNFRYFLGISRNIHARKKAEFRNQRLLNIIELSLNEIHIFNKDSLCFEYLNARAINNLQYSEAELLKMTPVDIKPEYNQDSFRRMIKPLLLKKKSLLIFETRHQRKDGSVYNVQVNLQLLEIEQQILFVAIILDITDFRNTQNRLLESESRFRQLAEATVEGIVFHHKGIIRDLNERACELFGYPRHEMIGRSVLTLASPDYLELIRRNVETGFEGTYEAQGRRKDGTLFWAELRSRLFRDGEEEIRITTLWDISDRVEAAEALKQSENKYRALVENLKEVIFSTLADGTLLYVSPSITQITGYRPEEITGHNFFEFVDPDDIELFRKSFASGLRENQPPADYRIRVKDGSHRWIRSSSLQIIENGHITGIQGIMTDITEYMNARQALADSELKYQRLFESTRDIFFILDPAGNVVDISPSVEYHSGYAREEIIGQNAGFLIRKSSTHANLIAAIGEKQEINNMEVLLTRKDGDQRWVLLNAKLIFNVSGDFTGIEGSMHDINDRKLAEDALRDLNLTLEQKVDERTRQLQQSNTDLEMFSYSVSHDLQAPLRHIDGFARMLEESLENRNPETEKYLQKIYKAASQMNDLIHDLLSFSRMGRKVLNLQMLDLHDIVNEQVNLLAADHARKNIQWTVDVGGKIMGDYELIKVVINNLLINAIKFSSRSNPQIISIQSKIITPGYIAIKFSDNGVGFDQKYADKLFGVFQRLHTDAEFIGNGIGLANVKRIVVSHGGMVTAEGIPNQGAVFTVQLPLITD